jgi:hypothetical protein
VERWPVKVRLNPASATISSHPYLEALMNLQQYKPFLLVLIAFALVGAAGLLWMTIFLS